MADMHMILGKVHSDIFSANATILDSYKAESGDLVCFEFRPVGGTTKLKIPMILINPPNTMILKSVTVEETSDQICVKTYVLERDETVSSMFDNILGSVHTVDDGESV